MPRLSVIAALLASLVLAAPVAAQQPTTDEREAAVEALEQAQAVAQGAGVTTGRELSQALAELAARRTDLRRAQRREATSLLARPTDPNDDGPGALGPYTAPSVRSCSEHFCVHWVESTNDAPDLTDGPDSCLTPDYVDALEQAFEQSYAVQNGRLGWRTPVLDAGRGGDDRTDVYVQDIGGERIFGYASADPQPDGRSKYAYLVMDDDYAADEFPDYGGDASVPLQVTAAHEYNHILQFGYDSEQDPWMFESTATWAEDKVFDPLNDYHAYVSNWAQRSPAPLTDANQKEYGSAVWNHWLDGKFGAAVVREAWSLSVERSVGGLGFAPGAYDAAIRNAGGPGFAAAFGDFAASTAEWAATNSDIHEGGSFPPVARQAAMLALDAAPLTGTLDHTGYALFGVERPGAGVTRLDLNGRLPLGTPGTFALVGLTADNIMVKAIEHAANGGPVTVTLPEPGRFSRITAVAVNAATSHTGFDSSRNDWRWSRNAQTTTLAVATGTGGSAQSDVVAQLATSPTGGQAGPVPAENCGGPQPTPNPSPTSTQTSSPPPMPTPEVTATSVRLGSGAQPRLRRIARRGYVTVIARVNKAGRLTATGMVNRRTARRLRVGLRATKVGTGRRAFTHEGRFEVKVRLSKKVLRALKRQRRTVELKVRVRFVPDDASGAVTRTVTLRLRR